ncbi:MAG: ABC transporter permease [Bacillales bacterium]|jgi:multidrug/hemolysin transport system permease protein|nr:ABC transporter permease [Bacillales bacterium]
MTDLIALTKRNIKVFLRDKMGVFFSFLSVIIMLFLYFAFLGKTYSASFSEYVSDKNLINFLSLSQMMGGVLVINTLSLAVGVSGTLVNDQNNNALDSLLVTPIKRYKITLAYYLSVLFITYVLTVLMWLITVLYVGFTTTYWYSFSLIIIIVLVLLLFTIISTAIMVFLATIIKSSAAFGALASIIGTVIGFMSGIYMPLVVLGQGTKYVASCVPFTHMTIFLKGLMLKEPLSYVPFLSGEALKEVRDYLGINNIGFLGLNVPLWALLIGCCLLAFGLGIASVYIMKRKLNK